jgi:molecular chaperone GrpE
MHEAVLQTESADVPANVVALELEKGYRLGERVLRHAKVGVSLGAEALPNDQVRAPAETIEPELGAGPTYPDDLTQEDTGISPDI